MACLEFIDIYNNGMALLHINTAIIFDFHLSVITKINIF